jgi:hypothetical protein
LTLPHLPGPRPGPPAGGFRPSPPPARPDHEPDRGPDHETEYRPESGPRDDSLTGHPAVDAVLQALANAAQLPPAEQIAEYEAAHQTLQETLASIDR